MDDLRVLIIADDSLARAGLAALLSAQPGCTVLGQIASEEQSHHSIQPSARWLGMETPNAFPQSVGSC